MDSDRPELEVIPSPETETRTMTLWHRELTPNLQRTLVRREGAPDYYRIPYALPVLELSPSNVNEWNGRPGLLAGRVYGGADFATAPEAYSRWYDALARWIRSHFVKNPAGKHLGGYAGKAAFEWFRQGNLLLPVFSPPVTPAWTSFFAEQDTLRSALTPPDSNS